MFTQGAEEEKLHTSSLSLWATLSLSLPQPLGSSATSAQSHQRGTSGASLTPTETNAIGHGPLCSTPTPPLYPRHGHNLPSLVYLSPLAHVHVKRKKE